MDTFSSRPRVARRSALAWVALAAVLFFSLGMLGGLAAALGAAFTGALFWWLLIERPAKPTYRRGACFGFLAQLAAYPVIYWISGFLGIPAGFGDLPAFIHSGLILSVEIIVELLHDWVIWVGVHSLGVLITGPIGVAGGLVLVALRRRFPTAVD